MSNKALVIRGLTYTYPETQEPALSDISFDLDYGQVLGVVGPTGAGKTTLALAIMGLIPNVLGGAMGGEVIVGGTPTNGSKMDELSRKVGLVFQEPENQLSQMTVEEEVAFGMANLGTPRKVMERRIPEALSMVGLDGFEKRSPLALSGGQQQRLAIASVLAMRPSVIVLDEPTSMLDPIGKDEVFNVLTALRGERRTVIIIEHEVERLAEFCDGILLLSEGRIKALGAPREVFGRLKKLAESKVRPPQVTQLSELLIHEDGWLLSVAVTLDEAYEGIQAVLNRGPGVQRGGRSG